MLRNQLEAEKANVKTVVKRSFLGKFDLFSKSLKKNAKDILPHAVQDQTPLDDQVVDLVVKVVKDLTKMIPMVALEVEIPAIEPLLEHRQGLVLNVRKLMSCCFLEAIVSKQEHFAHLFL
eukprot:5450525-Amphidinium_carterae.1